ncbi:SafA/ExsA family spore coat assembly protein [Clostridium tetani]|uniref:LysM peptidoglycan-binding domain-containing protein n=1 Tax=Clostridium tetani TaxID=1513 RepID=A0ABY0ET82_CLOTA|nr:SafA/ExsA family spore coat assembly protein [Clostridium tetani]CDI50541.1 transporter [Clostridium tetani 12124569]KHO32635.1 hypothetical protein OR62_12335 [Clostridium tetani]RXI39335.1 LysM peptidoglycan-binding domain-containing protein [Clostridium tetani]RXI57368.1 LysM peptidoglycan-binding domain-containing protein [Clostridium tetani]RXI66946.1 LysM peptidoglycan-binding domain-containing protein [Clostridium tetani]
MLKKLIVPLSLSLALTFPVAAKAQGTYTIQKGDSLWKIAVKNQVGLDELISANPQLKNPSLIYPGAKISIPSLNETKSMETEVVRLVNIERANNGLAPLNENWELSRVARFKSNDMIAKNYFSHTSPTYGSPFKMMTSFGLKYSSAGENIAMGQRTPKEVVQGWMNSPGHRRNILNKNFTEIGIGVSKDSKGNPYWTQMFIRP